MVETLNLSILVIAGLVALSIFSTMLSYRLGAPLLLVFLGVGLAAGVDGPGGIVFDDASTAYAIGSVGLAVVLFDSGFRTHARSLRRSALPALLLASLGVVITAALVGGAAHWFLGLGWVQALLLGAILASTDAAAVFFLLRVGGITIRDRVRSVLEIESGSNDPMAIFLAIILIRFLIEPGMHEGLGGAILVELGREFGLGALIGGLGGGVIVLAVNRLAVERGLLPIAALSLALVVFGAASALGGSGFLAVYIAGMVAGNSRLAAPETLRRFQDGATWLAQIAMFLTLGLLATPSEFPAILPGALAVAVVLIVLARPVAAWLCLLPFGTRANETAFVAWVGLRGAVGILLGLLPMVAGLPDGRLYFNVAFIVVMVSLSVQGWTIRPVARWLGQIVPPRIGPVERMELEIPGARHELVSYRIVADSLVAGEDQRLPRWAVPSLVLREGRSLLGASAGRLRPGDTVYLFARPERLAHLDRLFASPATQAEADRQFFGDFALDPNVRMEAVSFLYDVAVAEADRGLRLDEFLVRELARAPGIGDRVGVGCVELIVRALSHNGAIAEVGLALEPTRIDDPRLPLFPTAAQVIARIRRLLS